MRKIVKKPVARRKRRSKRSERRSRTTRSAGSQYDLTRSERTALAELKRNADRRGRERWVPFENFSKKTDGIGYWGVCNALERNFDKVVGDLSKRFPGKEIRVLFEGAGFSSFPERLVAKCKKRGLRVRVFRTDLYSKKRFREFATESPENKRLQADGLRMNTRDYERAAPEELVEVFGRNSFHLVVSRSGGLNYTRFSPVKGISNVSRVLKPGGEAHIFTEDVDMRPLPIGTAIWLRHSPDLQKYFENHPKYKAKEDVHITGTPFTRQHPIIRIRKGIPWE